MATFNNYVFNTASETPPPLGVSLSASNNGVILTTLNGTLCGKTVVGILFNQVASASANLVNLSAGTVGFRVSRNYHGQQMAMYFSDRSTTTFTVNSGVAAQTLNGLTFDNRGPDEIRRHNLGYF